MPKPASEKALARKARHQGKSSGRKATVSSSPHGSGHVPAVAIGALSMVLAIGLNSLGILDRINQAVSNWFSAAGVVSKSLPVWAVWLAALACAFGISFSLLNVNGTWRQVVLWCTSIVLVIGWAPVLVLAAHAPDIAAPLIAVVWSGICAFVHASRHQQPAAEASSLPPDSP